MGWRPNQRRRLRRRLRSYRRRWDPPRWYEAGTHQEQLEYIEEDNELNFKEARVEIPLRNDKGELLIAEPRSLETLLPEHWFGRVQKYRSAQPPSQMMFPVLQ